MDALQLQNEIKDFCLFKANKEIAEKSQRYFKSPLDMYGLATPQLYAQVKVMLENKNLSLTVILESISKYLIYGKYEETTIGILLLINFSNEFTPDTFKEIEVFFTKGIHNWAHADMLGMFILPKFLIHNIVRPNDFIPWTLALYKFQRRCVPVTFIKAMKLDKECSRYIELVEPLIKDSDREVHQGVGWFMREAWKIDRKTAEAFLGQWKDTAPRIIIQYACEKMTTEEKMRFKRVK